MGWRFRQNFRSFPKVRLHLSDSGIRTTISHNPFSLPLKSKGAAANVGLPDMGISPPQKLSVGNSNGQPPSFLSLYAQEPVSLQEPYSMTPQMYGTEEQKTEVQSVSPYEPISQNLENLRQLLTDAQHELQKLDAEIEVTRQEIGVRSAAFEKWNHGFVFKHILPGRFTKLAQAAQRTRDKLQELSEQRHLTRIALEVEIDRKVLPYYEQVAEAFANLATCQGIWDTTSTKSNPPKLPANIERKQARFALAQSEAVRCDWQVPWLENARGGDLYLYPGFLLCRATPQSFAVVDCREVDIALEANFFPEEEPLPSDAKVVGQTWKHTNKDGTRDERYSYNYAIPVAQYATLRFAGPTGLQAEYMVSNFQAGDAFVTAWHKFRAVISS